MIEYFPDRVRRFWRSQPKIDPGEEQRVRDVLYPKPSVRTPQDVPPHHAGSEPSPSGRSLSDTSQGLAADSRESLQAARTLSETLERVLRSGEEQ